MPHTARGMMPHLAGTGAGPMRYLWPAAKAKLPLQACFGHTAPIEPRDRADHGEAKGAEMAAKDRILST